MKADLHPLYRKLTGGVRLRKPVRDPLDLDFHSRGSLRPVPPVLHRQAAPGGHRRPSGPVPPQVPERAGGHGAQGVTRGGQAPPGTAAGGGGRQGTRRPARRPRSRTAQVARARAHAARARRASGRAARRGCRTSWPQARELADEADPELAALARADVTRLAPEIATLSEQLHELLLPAGPARRPRRHRRDPRRHRRRRGRALRGRPLPHVPAVQRAERA